FLFLRLPDLVQKSTRVLVIAAREDLRERVDRLDEAVLAHEGESERYSGVGILGQGAQRVASGRLRLHPVALLQEDVDEQQERLAVRRLQADAAAERGCGVDEAMLRRRLRGRG